MIPSPVRGIVLVVLLSLAFIAFALRPTPLLGVDGGSLGYSVDSNFDSSPCKQVFGDGWRCDVWDSSMSGSIGYSVTVDSFGCWSARRRAPEARAAGAPARRSGCVTLWDHLRPFDRLL